MNGYDLIGDIHGQAGKLEALLGRLGYGRNGAGWRPPEGRQAIFLGDLIDRGPEQRKVVETVRAMIDAGHARCVLGNHELNAIAWALPRRGKPGSFLREHSAKNQAQHAEFLRQIGEGSAMHAQFIEWFRTLPPMLDLGTIRVVHAWWHQPHVDLVSQVLPPGARMDDDFMHTAHEKGSALWEAVDGLTKGLEIELPEGHSFLDHARIDRHEVRTKWWLDNPRSFRDVALLDEVQRERIPADPLPPGYKGAAVSGAPVFIGHYWLVGCPELQSPKVVCVDYSAAADGPLVAYRWDGEQMLDAAKFVAAG